MAQALPPASPPPTVTDLLLEGYCARSTAGYHASLSPLRAAVAALRADDLDPERGLQWFGLGIMAAGSLWDEQAVFDLSDRMVRAARALGALTILPVGLAFLAISNWLTGRFGDAGALWAEMRELLAETNLPRILGIDSRGHGLLLEYRGRLTEARAAGIAQVHESTARGQRAVVDVGRYIVAVADLFGGDFQAAASSALSVIDDDSVFTSEASLPEMIEAAVRAGDRQAAATAYETLSERTLAAGTPWALGVRARSQALLDQDGHAEDAYLESLSQLERSRVTIELARTHLLYGQWLRRAKRRRDARQELRTAQDMFAAMGSERFAEVAGSELRASGERARARTPETTFDLTPQEAHIAGLAAGGASNNEIAAQLFLSPSTVDYHLRKVYRKLNVTSRAQLARSLGPGSTGSGAPGTEAPSRGPLSTDYENARFEYHPVIPTVGGMSNEPTAIRKDSPQPPLPVPAPRRPAEATDLHVDVLSTAPLVVGVSGEIDIASAPKLREELLGALRRHGARLALDLGGVTFMDCAGIKALLAARRHARLEGGWVRVARASRRARNILMLTGLHREFALAGSETAATA